MADPRPLTRAELEKFLPTQRAIRAFEQLLDKTPTDVEALKATVDSTLTLASNTKQVTVALEAQVQQLQLENSLLRRSLNIEALIKRVEMLESLLETLQPQNLQSIKTRVENLEVLTATC